MFCYVLIVLKMSLVCSCSCLLLIVTLKLLALFSGAMQAQANSGALVLADDLKSPAMEKLDLVRKWSINTYKVILSEVLLG